MNWDWEKLQEKRQRQGKNPRQENDDQESPFGGFDLNSLKPELGRKFSWTPVVACALLLWLASGIFIVKPGEVGVVTFFGRYDREVAEGPHYHLPFPVEAVSLVNVALLRTEEIGTATQTSAGRSRGRQDASTMFTEDENIVHMHFNVQYKVSDARKFLFKARDPVGTLIIAAEAAMREVVGGNKVEFILTEGRGSIEEKAKASLAEILAGYDMGIAVDKVQLHDVEPPAEVDAKFKGVASAREEKERIITVAEAYRVQIVPLAKGEASALLNAARAYRTVAVQEAEGEASKFSAMAKEYAKAPEITKKRLYLDAMADILSSPGMEKTIISKEAAGKLLPLLPLDGKPLSSAVKGPAKGTPEGAAR